MLNLFLALFLFAAGIAASGYTSDHFVLTQAGTLAVMRMDPIVNPGTISGHLHTVVGGSLFGANLGAPGDLTKSECSTIIIGDDKSNYWAPSLLYKYENGSLSQILHQTRIYYFLKTPDVKPFPPGFRMISGNPGYRNASDPKAMGVLWNCDHDAQTKELPTQTPGRGPCTGIGAGIFFPSCGLADGSLDSDNHFDHITWPSTSPAGVTPNGRDCPPSHPIKYPTIFLEINYYLTSDQPWRNDPDLLVLANGDAVGSTYHADFHNGWVPETLAATIEQCGFGKSVGDHLDKCPPLAKSYQPEGLRHCRLQGEIVDEDIGLYRPLDKLPGCNTIWTSKMGDSRPVCKEEVKPAFIKPAFIKPSVYFNNLRYWLAIPIAQPKDIEIRTTSDVLPVIPSLGFFGASTLRKWIWADATNENALQPEIVLASSSTAGVSSLIDTPATSFVKNVAVVATSEAIREPGPAETLSSAINEASVSGAISSDYSSPPSTTPSANSSKVAAMPGAAGKNKTCKRTKRSAMAARKRNHDGIVRR